MKLTIFDVQSFFGFYRKHFSTTSSLSYSFPPRTSIVGMIAAILGYERDAYYNLFTSEACRIALQIRTPVRRVTNTVNYLMTDKPLTVKKLRGMGGQMPTHVETLLADERGLSPLCYRIFFSHEDEKLQDELTERIRDRRFTYPPSFGSASNIAEAKYVDLVDAEVYRPDGEVDVHTVLPVSVLKNLRPQKGAKIHIEELVPAVFTEDRKLKREENYIYEGKGKPIKASLKCEVFVCTVDGAKIAGVFM
jgi:CRISPR-associated protein Cas5h